MTAISNTDDIIDVRDLMVAVEASENGEDSAHGASLRKLLDELRGQGGDAEWRGDWYPLMLIRDSHFRDYTRELVEEIGGVPKAFPGYIEIDWEATARNIRGDYTAVEFDGVTYWFR